MHLEERKALASFPAPGLRVDSLFSLPDASSNTGNSGAAGSPSQAVNFPSAGNVQLGVAGNVQLGPRGGPASVLTLGRLQQSRPRPWWRASQQLTFIKPGLVPATLTPRTFGVPGCASSWGCVWGKCSLLCPGWQNPCLAQDRYSGRMDCRKWSPSSAPCL